MLQSLCRQCASWGNKVEIVVSDNASTDATRAAVDAACFSVAPIRYFRNDENVGSRNFLLAVERASGEYAWVLGDDGTVRWKAGCAPFLEVLRAHHDIDYFYTNFFTARMVVRGRAHGRRRFRVAARHRRYSVVRDFESRPLNSWEHIFDLPTSNAVEVTARSSPACSAEERDACRLPPDERVPDGVGGRYVPQRPVPACEVLAHAMAGQAALLHRPALCAHGAGWPGVALRLAGHHNHRHEPGAPALRAPRPGACAPVPPVALAFRARCRVHAAHRCPSPCSLQGDTAGPSICGAPPSLGHLLRRGRPPTPLLGPG